MSRPFVFEPESRPSVGVRGSALRFPVHRIYCVGRNYRAHAREMGESDREPPFFFTKPADAVIQDSRVPWPSQTRELHHEVELVVAIGKSGFEVDEQQANSLVHGYAVGVDLTRRDLQARAKAQARPWDVAKGFDASAPISHILPANECGFTGEGRIFLEVDGVTRQDGNLSEMIWPVAGIICQLSRYFILKPGDLVFTGTPEGVGALQPGSAVRCGIERVGQLEFIMGDGNG